MKAGACVCRLPLPVSFLCAGVFVGHRFHLTKLWKYLKFPNVCVPGGYFFGKFLKYCGEQGQGIKKSRAAAVWCAARRCGVGGWHAAAFVAGLPLRICFEYG